MTKISKFLLFSFCILFLCCFVFTSCVKAESFAINLSNISYYAYNNGYTAGATCTSGHCDISGNTFIMQNYDIKFKPSSYWGYGGYTYVFNITSTASIGNLVLTAKSITDNNYNAIGICESFTNSTGQITSLTAVCRLSNNGLVNGLNIIRLGASSIYSNNQLSFTTLLNPQVYAIENGTCDATCMANVINSLKLNDNTNTNAIISAINNQNTSINNISTNIQNQNTQQHNDSTTINNSITSLNDTITDSTIDSDTNTDSISDNINSTTSNNVLNFMLIPLNFVQSIINGFENSCSQVCLGNCGSGHDNDWRFIFPCIDIRSYIGNAVYNTIDALMCISMIFAFLHSVVGFAKKALLLESDVSSEVRVFL